MSIRTVLALLVTGIAQSYWLGALILEKKDHHEGPFKSKENIVVFPEGGDGFEYWAEHRQSVCLWDHIRKVFGVYEIEGWQWTVKKDASEPWSCPFCLSFWLAIPTAILFIREFKIKTILGYFGVHGFIAILSQVFHKYLDEESEPTVFRVK